MAADIGSFVPGTDIGAGTLLYLTILRSSIRYYRHPVKY
jgi:hypothetical protein